MIVPENRLLWAFGLTLIPFALTPAIVPALFPSLGGLTALALAAALLDALLMVGRHRGVRMELPERVALSLGREASLELTLRNERGRALPLRFAPGLPAGIVSTRPPGRILLPAGGAPLRVAWPVRGARRGEFVLERCHFRVPSPLGLWARQAFLPAGTRLVVYPDLAAEQRKLAAFFLRRGDAGLHPHRQIGQGREFEKLRDYLPGDSLGDIHWKATAKRGHPVTKEYQIERTQEVYVVVDASRLSAVAAGTGEDGAEGEPVLERYLAAALTLGMVAQRQGDLFGLLTFGDRILSFVRANSGKAHFGACRDALFRLQPQSASPDFAELASFINLRLRRRSLLLVLTSLDDPALAESFVESLGTVARRHLILVAMPRPAAARPLFTGPAAARPEEIYQRLGGHLLWHNLRELERVLRQRGIGFSLADQGSLSTELVSHYVSVKRRQIL